MCGLSAARIAVNDDGVVEAIDGEVDRDEGTLPEWRRKRERRVQVLKRHLR